jgi:hypothetical protein
MKSRRMKWLGLTTHILMKGNAYRILVGKLERLDHLEDARIGGRIILKVTLEEEVGRRGLNSCG